MNKKTEYALMAFIIVIVVLSVGTAAYWSWLYLATGNEETEPPQTIQRSEKANGDYSSGIVVTRISPRQTTQERIASAEPITAGNLYKNDQYGFQLMLPKEWGEIKTETGRCEQNKDVNVNCVSFIVKTDTDIKDSPLSDYKMTVFDIEVSLIEYVEQIKKTSPCTADCVDFWTNMETGQNYTIPDNCNWGLHECKQIVDAIGQNNKYVFTFFSIREIVDPPEDVWLKLKADYFDKIEPILKTFKISNVSL